jgi:hypothetical protein
MHEIHRSAVRAVTLGVLLATCLLGARARAQSAVDPGDVGYEVTLSGGLRVERGAPLRVFGIAYEVQGLAALTPREGLDVVAELTTRDPRGHDQILRTVSVRSVADGRFELVVPTPTQPLGHSWLAIRVRRPGRTGRVFSFPVQVVPDRALDLLSDRERYEPGEVVHAWARTFSMRTRAPVADVSLTIELLDAARRPMASQEVVTRASGAVSADLTLPSSAAPGTYMLVARSADRELTTQRTIEVFQRTAERLLASVSLDQEMVLPGGALTGRVRVTAPSGSPVRGARVQLWLQAGRGEPVELVTDENGVAAIDGRAPSFLSGDVSSETILARVVHAAYGTITASAGYTLSRTRWQVEARAENGALVPEIEGTLFLAVADARGRPIAAGQEVELRGLGVIAGRSTARTDARGLAELRVRLPRGAAARMQGGRCASAGASTSFEVEVRTRPVTVTRVCVPVSVEAQLALRATRPVGQPGAPVEVDVTRRPSANGRPVLLELMSGAQVRAFGWIPSGQTHGSIAVPADLAAGVWTIRARPVSAADARGPLDGAGVTAVREGSSVAVLLRQPDAFALTVAPGQPLYHVRERAQVTLSASSAPPAGQAWAALLVRDEAMQGGEMEWAREYLSGELRDAMRTPSAPADERFLRATLAASVTADDISRPPPPIVVRPWDQERYGYGGWGQTSGLLRDPIGLREELYRRQLGPVMMQLEQRVEQLGADQEARSRLLRTTGRRVEFAPDVLARMHAEGYGQHRTLGGELMTAAMLTQADPSFSFDAVARRVARRRLVRLLVALAAFVNPADSAAQRASANEPPERWLSRLVQLGVIDGGALVDPWGRPFALRRVTGRRPVVVLTERAIDWELSSPGPDGVPGNADDVRDPFLRAVPRGTIYATASGEDSLMEMLSRIAPGEQVLGAMARAYQALSLAAEEERTASVVTATSTEEAQMPMEAPAPEAMDMEMAMGGEGGGGAAATGMAMPSAPPPAQAMAPGRARAQMAREDLAERGPVGEAEADRDADGILDSDDRFEDAPTFLGTASSLVREEFPATLHFVGEVSLDAQGRAEVGVPLLDALTTYRLEAIAWTSSGWITSGRGDLRVDQDAMVDAPVPEAATVGDVIRLPVRIQNRTAGVLAARVEVALEGDVGLEIGAPPSIEVAARDAGEAVIELRARRAGSGTILVRALTRDGTPLDAVRRPVDVGEDARLVRLRRLDLVEGGDTLAFEVPDGAAPRGPGELRLSVAGAMFGNPTEWGTSSRIDGGDVSWAGWALAMDGAPLPSAVVEQLLPMVARRPELGDATYVYTGYDAARVARALGALWSDERMSDEDALGALRFLSGAEPVIPEASRHYRPEPQIRDAVTVLLALAPAVRSGARPAVHVLLREAVARIATEAANEGARASDDPRVSVRVAAALALSGGSGEVARAREMLRRAEREVVAVGDQSWLETDDGDGTVEPRLYPTSLLALAYLGLGEPRSALPLLRTLARAARGAPYWPTEGRALASAAASRLTRGTPGGEVRLTLDGAPVESRVENGIVIATIPAIGRPGQHVVGLGLEQGVLALASLEVRYGLGWDRAPARPAPIELAWEGDTGARETRSALRLTIRNRGTRVLVRPVVEVQLPAGAELDEPTRDALSTRLAAPASVEGSTLRLELRALAPGGYVRLPVPARWSVGGTLRGLGASAWDDAQPTSGEDLSVAVLPSREVTIADRGEEPEAPESEASPPPRPPEPIPLPIDPMPRALSEGIR